MGFRVLLIAVTGKTPAEVHERYGVVPTDQHEEIPESPVTSVVLPNGAYLLYINDEIIPNDRVFARLSQDASLNACYANETVMNSYASAWKNGTQQWSVFHDAEQGLTHLETEGTLPSQLTPIQDSMLAKQRDCEDTDYVFDIPIELFAALGGVRYDQDIDGADPEPWQVLNRVSQARVRE